MPKSKNRKTHKAKLAKYKSNKKKEQESFKKKMIENYIKMQQQAVADKEAHTSTQEVSGPEVNIDELVEDWEAGQPKVENTIIETNDIMIDNTDIILDNVEISQENDNNNK